MKAHSEPRDAVRQLTPARFLAGLLGGFLATVALTVAISLLWPWGDRIEQIFAGGVLFFLIWSWQFYWALLAPSLLWAWARPLLLALLAGALDVLCLTLLTGA